MDFGFPAGESHPPLEKLPTRVLLSIAVDLDADVLDEASEKGLTRGQLIGIIEGHARQAIGNRAIPDWQYIGDTDVSVEDVYS